MYIHQHKNSPKFTWNIEKIIRLLLEIRHKQVKMLRKMEVVLGKGKGFVIKSEPMFTLLLNQFLHDIDFADLDGDKTH